MAIDMPVGICKKGFQTTKMVNRQNVTELLYHPRPHPHPPAHPHPHHSPPPHTCGMDRKEEQTDKLTENPNYIIYRLWEHSVTHLLVQSDGSRLRWRSQRGPVVCRESYASSCPKRRQSGPRIPPWSYSHPHSSSPAEGSAIRYWPQLEYSIRDTWTWTTGLPVTHLHATTDYRAVDKLNCHFCITKAVIQGTNNYVTVCLHDRRCSLWVLIKPHLYVNRHSLHRLDWNKLQGDNVDADGKDFDIRIATTLQSLMSMWLTGLFKRVLIAIEDLHTSFLWCVRPYIPDAYCKPAIARHPPTTGSSTLFIIYQIYKATGRVITNQVTLSLQITKLICSRNNKLQPE